MPISETICKFYSKSATILGNLVLKVESGGRISVLLIEKIVDAGGQLQVLDDVAAEKREIEGSEAFDIVAGHRGTGGECMANTYRQGYRSYERSPKWRLLRRLFPQQSSSCHSKL